MVTIIIIIENVIDHYRVGLDFSSMAVRKWQNTSNTKSSLNQFTAYICYIWFSKGGPGPLDPPCGSTLWIHSLDPPMLKMHLSIFFIYKLIYLQRWKNKIILKICISYLCFGHIDVVEKDKEWKCLNLCINAHFLHDPPKLVHHFQMPLSMNTSCVYSMVLWTLPQWWSPSCHIVDNYYDGDNHDNTYEMLTTNWWQ